MSYTAFPVSHDHISLSVKLHSRGPCSPVDQRRRQVKYGHWRLQQVIKGRRDPSLLTLATSSSIFLTTNDRHSLELVLSIRSMAESGMTFCL